MQAAFQPHVAQKRRITLDQKVTFCFLQEYSSWFPASVLSARKSREQWIWQTGSWYSGSLDSKEQGFYSCCFWRAKEKPRGVLKLTYLTASFPHGSSNFKTCFLAFSVLIHALSRMPWWGGNTAVVSVRIANYLMAGLGGLRNTQTTIECPLMFSIQCHVRIKVCTCSVELVLLWNPENDPHAAKLQSPEYRQVALVIRRMWADLVTFDLEQRPCSPRLSFKRVAFLKHISCAYQ